jgi:eukaryotic-like serine/threonine-protein kinase
MDALVSPDEAPLERAVVFESAAGYRLICAQRLVAALPAIFGPTLIEVDLAATRTGPTVMVLARFRPAGEPGELLNRFLAQVQTDGGTAVALSELSFLERAEFLTRLNQCAWLRRAVQPAAVESSFEQLLTVSGLKSSADTSAQAQASPGVERRGAVRYQVDSPASVGPSPSAPALVENVSMTGAFIRTSEPAPVDAQVSLEIGLAPGHSVKVDATVVKASATGMAVQFVPGPELQQSLAEGLWALSEIVPDEPFRPAEAEKESLAARNRAAWDEAAKARNKAIWDEVAKEQNKAVWDEAAREWNKALQDEVAEKRRKAAWEKAAREWNAQVRAQLETVELNPAPVPAAPVDSGEAPAELPLLEATVLPPDPPKAVERLGTYELLSVLGRGGMGEVHYARATEGARAGQHVAIKRLLRTKAKDPEAVRLLLAEAETLAILKHRNIVRAYEVGSLEDEPFIVMEALDGRDLGQIIRQCKQRRIFVPIEFTCSVFKTWLDALGFIHRAANAIGRPFNLVHGDVSPHNLFISRSGEIKLTDFGLTQPAGNVGAERARARGKPTYLSPEALDGDVSVASDLWAVAVTLHELLCLEAPFQGDSYDELMKSIRRAKTPSVLKSRPTIPAWLDAVLQKALQKKVTARYQSATELAAAFTPHFDARAVTPAAIAEVVSGLFPTKAKRSN